MTPQEITKWNLQCEEDFKKFGPPPEEDAQFVKILNGDMKDKVVLLNKDEIKMTLDRGYELEYLEGAALETHARSMNKLRTQSIMKYFVVITNWYVPKNKLQRDVLAALQSDFNRKILESEEELLNWKNEIKSIAEKVAEMHPRCKPLQISESKSHPFTKDGDHSSYFYLTVADFTIWEVAS